MSISNRTPSVTATPNAVRGIGLVELMIALILGLLLIGGVINLFVTNRAAFRTTEQLSRLQENARTSFELMARSMRDAGGTPCGRDLPMANVITDAATTWWANWADGIRGYDGDQAIGAVSSGTNAGDRIAGTDALFVLSADANVGSAISSHDTAANQFTLSTAAHGLRSGDIGVACDYRQAAIFEISLASSSSNQIGYGGTSGNCTTGLRAPAACGAGTTYEFQTGGSLMRLSSQIWYVGANGRGGRSLYRLRLIESGGSPASRTEEIAEGIFDMQLSYLSLNAAGALEDAYEEASDIADWSRVVAARIALTLQSSDAVGTDGSPLQRQMFHVVSLRNRLP